MIIRTIAIINSLLILVITLAGCKPLSSANVKTPVAEGANSQETMAPGATCSHSTRLLVDAPPSNLFISSGNGDNQVSLTVPSGSVLIASNRLFGATLGIIKPDYTTVMSSSPPKSIENIQISRGAKRAVYLVLEGLNPGSNYIETVDLVTRETKQIKAKNGSAILGYALESGGKRMVFTEVGLLGTSSRQASWNLLLADLENGWAKEILTSEMAQGVIETALIPFAWSDKTGEIYLYGTRPFSGGWGQGIWAIQPEGSGLRKVMDESKFINLPVLSPDGLQFAYLTSTIEALPDKYIPGVGASPGNNLLIMNLKTGQEQIISQRTGRAFGAMTWSSNSEEVISSQQEWQENNLIDTSIAAIPVNGKVEREIMALPPLSTITDIFDYGKDGALLWVNKTKTGLNLILKKRDAAPASILSIPDGRIKIVGYLQ